MSLTYIGPVALAIHGNPDFAWTAAADAHGHRGFQIGGVLEWGDIHQLAELVENPHRVVTVGAHSGVLEPVWAGDTLLSPANGSCLLQSMDPSPDQASSVTGLVPFSLAGVRLRNVKPVVVRSARALDNDFSLASTSLVVQPFWGVDPAGEPFVPSPGGTSFAREYDPRTTVDVGTPATDARFLRVYAGTVTA